MGKYKQLALEKRIIVNDFIPKIKDWLPEVGRLLRVKFIEAPHVSYLKNKKNKISVVILPGLFNSWSFYKPLLDSISMAGYRVYCVSALGKNLKNVETSAKIIKDFLEENNLESVVFIGHSKGGIIGKYYLQNLNEDKKVIKLITVSTPFSGSVLASLLPLKIIRDYSPDSKIIKEINSYIKVNSQIISITPSFDVIIRHKILPT